MPPIPPMPPPGIGVWAASFLGRSATIASVVIKRPAIEAAPCRALRTTFVGSYDRRWLCQARDDRGHAEAADGGGPLIYRANFRFRLKGRDQLAEGTTK